MKMKASLVITAPNGSTVLVTQVLEDSISLDESQIEQAEEDNGPEWLVIDKGSQLRKSKLVQDGKYSYVIKRTYKDTTYWRCSVRSKRLHCHANVIQKGDTFVQKGNHVHPGELGLRAKTVIASQVKTKANEQVFQSAAELVEDAITDYGEGLYLPNPDLLARRANRIREKGRPRHPADLNFELNQQYIGEDFFRADLRVGEARHILLATDAMLACLAKSKTWYLDGTFYVAKKPFLQLYSIHGFIRSGDYTKQVPLMFILMSHRRQRDYVAVLSEVKRLLPRQARISRVMMDFEIAVWKAVESEFPDAERKGCSFHWGQAVWRKVQSLGLTRAYEDNRRINRYIAKLLSLPLLPADSVEGQFNDIQARIPDTLTDLTQYVETNWINHHTWPPTSWSAYGQPVRTNNDLEGWHYRLNRKSQNQRNMYDLFGLLRQEAKQVTVQMRLIQDERLRKRQKKSYKRYHDKLFKLWEEYENGIYDVHTLLKKLTALQRPRC